MAWRRPGDKPLSEPMMVRLPTHICVARPQWVNFCGDITLTYARYKPNTTKPCFLFLFFLFVVFFSCNTRPLQWRHIWTLRSRKSAQQLVQTSTIQNQRSVLLSIGERIQRRFVGIPHKRLVMWKTFYAITSLCACFILQVRDWGGSGSRKKLVGSLATSPLEHVRRTGLFKGCQSE